MAKKPPSLVQISAPFSRGAAGTAARATPVSTLSPEKRKVFTTIAKTAAAEGASPQTITALHQKIIEAGGTHEDAMKILGSAARQAKVEKAAVAGLPGGYVKKQIQNVGKNVIGIPGGIIQTAGAVINDSKDLAEQGATTIPGVGRYVHAPHTRPFGRTGHIAKEMAVATKQVAEHPLRDLPATLLTVSAVASAGAGTVGRAAAVGKAVSKGAGRGAIAKAALKRPEIQNRYRYIHGEDGQVKRVAMVGSKNQIANLVQRKVLDAHANKRLARANLVPGGHALTEPLAIASADQAAEVTAAMHAISNVHSSRPLGARATVMAEQRLGGALGLRTGVHDSRLPSGVRPVAVEFDPTKEGVGATVTHEMGHVLQDTVKGKDAQVLAAIAKTNLYRELHDHRVNGTHKAYANYLTQPQEFFARAYTQYIAEKSGHAPIGEGIDRFDKQLKDQGFNQNAHWSKEDFAPVREAFDKMFQDLHYQTKSGKPMLAMREAPLSRYVGAHATAGRELRANRRVQDEKQLAQVSHLEHFGSTKPAVILRGVSMGRFEKTAIRVGARAGRLTAAEQKAVDIASSGKDAATHVKYTADRIKELKALREKISLAPREGPGALDIISRSRQVQKINKAIFRQEAQLALTHIADEHLKAMPENLQKAIDESRAAIQAREDLLGLGPDEVAHRVGERAVELDPKSVGQSKVISDLKAGNKEAQAIGGKLEAWRQQSSSPLVERDALSKRLHRIRDANTPAAVKEAAAITDRLNELKGQIIRQGDRAISDGAFYVPSMQRYPQRGVSSFVRSKVPGPLGVGPPRKLPELSHQYTGALQRTGNFRTDVTGLVAESYRRAQSYAALTRAHKELLSISHSTKEAAGRYAIPIRENWSIPETLKNAILKADRGELTAADIKAIDPRKVQDAARELFPSEADLNGSYDGIRFVDGRYLGALKSEVSYGGDLGKFFDTINNPFRAALLYTKPAYALNLLQAIGTNIVQQGVFTPVNMHDALTLGRKVGAEDQRIIFALNGQGLSRSLESRAGALKGGIDKAAETWNVVVDRYPRVSSWLHEARTRGFKTPEQIHQLLHYERYADELQVITRLANREAIDYGELTPVERNVLKRGLFFYPWMRGSTLWTLRFPMEHPIQAAAYYQLGGQGADRADRILGLRPTYDQGLIPVGKGGLSMDLTNLNNAATPIEAIQGIDALAHGNSPEADWFRQQLGPLPGAGVTLLTGTTSLGHPLPSGQSRLVGAGKELAGLIPGYTAYKTATRDPSTETNPAKQPIEPTGPGAAAKRYVGGRVWPVKRNQAALNAKGEAQYVQSLSKEERVSYRSGKQLQQAGVDAEFLHKHGIFPSAEVPPEVKTALDIRRRMQLAELGAGASDTLGRLQADLELAKQLGRADEARVKDLLDFAKHAPASRQKSLLSAIRSSLLGQTALSYWNGVVAKGRAAYPQG